MNTEPTSNPQQLPEDLPQIRKIVEGTSLNDLTDEELAAGWRKIKSQDPQRAWEIFHGLEDMEKLENQIGEIDAQLKETREELEQLRSGKQ